MDVTQPSVICQIHTQYVEEQSQPEKNRYIFAYTITIKNLSSQRVQLMERRWLITDANGKQLSIEGEGVVGQQPYILANDEYTYTSATSIETPVGVMQGLYIMHDDNGKKFHCVLEPFRLAIPNILN